MPSKGDGSNIWGGRTKSGRVVPLVRESLKAREIVEARLEGKSWYEIADERGITPASARSIWSRELKKLGADQQELLTEARDLELQRLDRLWEAWFTKAVAKDNPNATAAALCLQIAKHRAAIMGLEAAKQVQVGHAHLHINADQWNRAAEMAQDPNVLAALEGLAASFAHGDEALEGDYFEAPAELPPSDEPLDGFRPPSIDEPPGSPLGDS